MQRLEIIFQSEKAPVPSYGTGEFKSQ